MGEIVLQNVKILFGKYDLSCAINTVTLNYGAELKDSTTFCSDGFRTRKSGLKSFDITMSGFWDSSDQGAIDPVAFNALGKGPNLITIMPYGDKPGSLSFFGDGVAGEYSPGGSVGEMFGFNFVASGDGDLIRGKVIKKNLTKSILGEKHIDLGPLEPGQQISIATHLLSDIINPLGISIISSDNYKFDNPIAKINLEKLTETPVLMSLGDESKVKTDNTWCKTSVSVGGNVLPDINLIISAGVKK